MRRRRRRLHIRCLLLTLIYHYMRPMLEAGRVYAAQPPLFSSKWRGRRTTRSPTTNATKSRAEHKIPLDKWVRFKGLGEMDVDELAVTTLDPSRRILKRMTMDDAAEAKVAAEMFETLMGSDVAARREFVLTNSELVDRDALDI